jgi:monofunctional chorismate mutase
MDLASCRIEIDKLDCELARLLERRMAIVADVAAYKNEHGLAVYDREREQHVLDKVAARVENVEMIPHIRKVYQCIMDESKAYEETKMGR